MASMRAGVSVSRSMKAALPPFFFMSATSLAFSARIAAAFLRSDAAAAVSARFLVAVEASASVRCGPAGGAADAGHGLGDPGFGLRLFGDFRDAHDPTPEFPAAL